MAMKIYTKVYTMSLYMCVCILYVSYLIQSCIK